MRLIGVGNRWRSDDGFGIRLIEGMQARLSCRWPLATAGSEAFDLLELLAEQDKVLIVDAMQMDSYQVGDMAWFSIRGQDLDALADFSPSSASTHGIGVFQLLRLCLVLLDKIPLIYVLGVQGADFSPGLNLSPVLAGRLSYLVDYLSHAKEIEECMNMPYLKTCWPR